MIEHILEFYNPSFAMAFFCLITAAMGAFLGANQVRIERGLNNYATFLGRIHAASEEDIHLIKSSIIGLQNDQAGMSVRISSHTKLIHDLTPKKKKRK